MTPDTHHPMLHYVKERAQRRIQDIEAAIVRERTPLSGLAFSSDDLSPGDAAAGSTGTWMSIAPGFEWSGAGTATWLRGRAVVPENWSGERVGLSIEISGGNEPLLYVDGVPAQALDFNHADVLLHDPAVGGEVHSLAIECYAPTRGGQFTLKTADLVRIDRDAYALYYDMTVAVEALDALDEHSREYQGALLGLEAAMQALDYTGQADVETRRIGWHDVVRHHRTPAFYASLPRARAALRREFFDAYPSLGERDPRMLLAGHAHIDVAYLWTVANTRKKVGRTFATALRLMDEYPEYHFTQSQPQLYAWCKEDYPDLYARIKERVAEGRWEPTGGMWVEADCNIPSGESLIRQILFGNRFFQREFGVRTRVLWLPDVFGYPASLPQILRGSGMDYFLTTKISWSQFNRMPNDTFEWRGIDGTGALTHFVTTSDPADGSRYTYNGDVSARQMRGSWDAYRQKDINEELLTLFGWGDGGGGPDRKMIESGRRYASLAGFPRAAFGGAEPFFARLDDRVADQAALLPSWTGELYLEYHRGTYTSQAATKRANRRCEVLFHDAELFSALAAVTSGAPYPQAELNRGWEKLLLNQFHDILPGSGIGPVYADAARDYAEIDHIGNRALATALQAVAGRIATLTNAVVLFNPTDTLRAAEVVRVTLPTDFGRTIEFADTDDAPLVSQNIGDNEYLVMVPEIGPLGYQTIGVGKPGGGAEASTVRAWAENKIWFIENDHLRAAFDEHGEIVTLTHKLPPTDDNDGGDQPLIEREVIAFPSTHRTGNALTVFEDKPLRYDAWDIDIFYTAKPYPLRTIATVESCRAIENGPVRAGIEVVRRFLHSTITQRIYLSAHSPMLTFETTVDWQERQMLLKVAFPVEVNATRATYDIQFGSVERPTHANTSWDVARFEVCAHKWADLSEGDYGVSLLNDCKYGHDIRDNVLRLTLLKGAVSPDPNADLGRHVFTYALLPHTGDWRQETVDAAYALNYPLLPVCVPANPKGALPAEYAFATVDDQGLIIETIKGAEDGDGIVIRLYEAFNTRGTATLTLGFPIAEAWAVNLVEECATAVEHTETTITFDFRPFQIQTFLVRPRA